MSDRLITAVIESSSSNCGVFTLFLFVSALFLLSYMYTSLYVCCQPTDSSRPT